MKIGYAGMVSCFAATFWVAACSAGDGKTRAAGATADNSSSTTVSALVPSKDSQSTDMAAMPGMNHGTMNTKSGTEPSRTNDMAGMKMDSKGPSAGEKMTPGMKMSGSTAGGGGMGGMKGMDMSPMKGMDMSGMAAGSPSHSGMTMNQPTSPTKSAKGTQGMQRDDITGDKLQRLLTSLVQDPIVRQRIQADSVLRNRWQDTAVQRILFKKP